jgi:hypothetical protein
MDMNASWRTLFLIAAIFVIHVVHAQENTDLDEIERRFGLKFLEAVKEPLHVRIDNLNQNYAKAVREVISALHISVVNAQAEGDLDLAVERTEQLTLVDQVLQAIENGTLDPDASVPSLLEHLHGIYRLEIEKASELAFFVHRPILLEFSQEMKGLELDATRLGLLKKAVGIRRSREIFVLNNLFYPGNKHIFKVERSAEYITKYAIFDGWKVDYIWKIAGRNAGWKHFDIRRTDGYRYPKTGHYRSNDVGPVVTISSGEAGPEYKVTLAQANDGQIRIGDAIHKITEDTYGKRDQVNETSRSIVFGFLGSKPIHYSYTDENGVLQEGIEYIGYDFELALSFAMTSMGMLGLDDPISIQIQPTR